MLAFLGYYLYAKNFLPEIQMIKESCNLIGQEHSLVYNLKLCVSNYWKYYRAYRASKNLPFIGQIRFFLGNPILSLFSVSRFLSLCKISDKSNEILGKLVTDIQKDVRICMNDLPYGSNKIEYCISFNKCP